MVHVIVICVIYFNLVYYHLFPQDKKHLKHLNDFSLCPPPSSLDEDAGFSPWSLWSPCTKTCTDALSPAMKSRLRQCIKPPCSGSSHQEKACNLPQCPGMTPPKICLCCCQSLWLLPNLSLHQLNFINLLLLLSFTIYISIIYLSLYRSIEVEVCFPTKGVNSSMHKRNYHPERNYTTVFECVSLCELYVCAYTHNKVVREDN